MSINNTDKFLVNRSNVSYHIESQNLMAELLDNDLMLINRGGVSYKITGAELKSTLGPAFVSAPFILTPADGTGAPLIASGPVTAITPAVTATYSTYQGSLLTGDAFEPGLVNVCGTMLTGERDILADCESLGIAPASSVQIFWDSGNRDTTIRLTFSDDTTYDASAFIASNPDWVVYPLTVNLQNKTIKRWEARTQYGSMNVFGFGVDGVQLINFPLSDAEYTASPTTGINFNSQVIQPWSGATGKVSGITASTIKLKNETGTFVTGQTISDEANYLEYRSVRVDRNNPTFTMTPAQASGASWSGTDLQIATDPAFSNIVFSVTDYQGSDTTVPTTAQLAIVENHYVRARHRGTPPTGSEIIGDWSSTSHFVTGT